MGTCAQLEETFGPVVIGRESSYGCRDHYERVELTSEPLASSRDRLGPGVDFGSVC